MGAFTIDKPMRHRSGHIDGICCIMEVSEGIERERVLIQAFQVGKNESGEAPLGAWICSLVN